MTDWPHAPIHRLEHRGTYIVTCATYRHEHYFRSAPRLTLLHNSLLALANEYGWLLQAWAVFSNHLHFVAVSPEVPATLRRLMTHLKGDTARRVNQLDATPGRTVWYQYRDTLLTNQRSYMARLRYVAENPVHHRLVADACTYPWCSAAWFRNTASRSFYESVARFKIDGVHVADDFEPVLADSDADAAAE